MAERKERDVAQGRPRARGYGQALAEPRGMSTRIRRIPSYHFTAHRLLIHLPTKL